MIDVQCTEYIYVYYVEAYLGQTGWSLSWAEIGHSGFPGSLLDT